MERFGPTRRGGPVFRWLGEPLAIDLANTVMSVRPGEVVDLLGTPADLAAWLEAERDRLGDFGFATAHLEDVRALRDAVHALLMAAARGGPPPADALERVNSASARAPVAPQIDRSFTVTEQDSADGLRRLLGAIARSAIALLGETERAELKICGAPSCGMFYLGARRWCCAACGNRARAARHYRRKRTQRETRRPRRA